MKEITREEYKKSQYKLYLIIISVVFFVILAYSLVWTIDYNIKYGYFKEITAKVVGFETENDTNYAVIEYIVGGNDYQKTTEYTGLEKGDKVVVYYDENNPLGIIYKKDARCFWLPMLSLIFGVVNIGLIILYLTTYNKKQQKEKKENSSK